MHIETIPFLLIVLVSFLAGVAFGKLKDFEDED